MKALVAAAVLAVLAVHPARASEDTPVEAPIDETPALNLARVRLTYYVEAGRTYSGGQTYPGSTACSWNFAIGTRFVFADGEEFVCNDRGLLGYSGWLDLWRRPDIARKYGAYATVQVIP